MAIGLQGCIRPHFWGPVSTIYILILSELIVEVEKCSKQPLFETQLLLQKSFGAPKTRCNFHPPKNGGTRKLGVLGMTDDLLKTGYFYFLNLYIRISFANHVQKSPPMSKPERK